MLVPMLPYVAAAVLGFIAGLRTFTPPAVLLLVRHRGLAAYVLAAAALLELAGDLYPNAPSRTGLAGIIARIVSGAFCGFAVATTSGASAALGATIGAAAAVAGAYLGLAARLRAIGLIGRVPAALAEDAVAIAVAIAVVI